jgi:hypothetical protein
MTHKEVYRRKAKERNAAIDELASIQLGRFVGSSSNRRALSGPSGGVIERGLHKRTHQQVTAIEKIRPLRHFGCYRNKPTAKFHGENFAETKPISPVKSRLLSSVKLSEQRAKLDRVTHKPYSVNA